MLDFHISIVFRETGRYGRKVVSSNLQNTKNAQQLKASWKPLRDTETYILTKAEVTKQAKTANSIIRNTKSKNYENLEKEAKDAHAAVVARENSLIAAKAEGILKSKALKKEVAQIEKRRAGKKTSNKVEGMAPSQES